MWLMAGSWSVVITKPSKHVRAVQEESTTERSKSSKLKEKIAALKKRMQQLKEIDVLVKPHQTNRSR